MVMNALKKTITVTSKGQVTIPREVRRRLGIKSGDKLVLAEDCGFFRLEAVREESPFEKYRGIGRPRISGGIKGVVRAVRKFRGR
jgi:AbrB family looped-hinge helix DNA binding protein